MGAWGYAPSEFWAMTIAEFWLIFDARRTDNEQARNRPSPDEYDEMLAFVRQGREAYDLEAIAENGFNR